MQEDLRNKNLGKTGEDLGAHYLESQGFRVLERNYRCRLGEIDIVAEKEGTLFFVEVKTRRSVDAVSPLELISHTKQVHLSRTAQHYVARHKAHGRSAEFALLILRWSETHPSFEWVGDIFPLQWGF